MADRSISMACGASEIVVFVRGVAATTAHIKDLVNKPPRGAMDVQGMPVVKPRLAAVNRNPGLRIPHFAILADVRPTPQFY